MIRRLVIAALLFFAYLVYLGFGNTANLAGLGTLAFAAMAQFAPGLVLGMITRNGNKVGMVCGLLAGFVCWLVLLILPPATGQVPIFLIHPDPLVSGVLVSLGANTAAFWAGSALGRETLVDAAQAAAFGRVTAELMRRSGQRLVNVIGVSPTVESLEALVEQPQVDAVVYFTFGAARMGYAGLHGNVAYLKGKPVVGARLSLWGDAASGDKVGVDGLAAELKTLPKDPADPNSKDRDERMKGKYIRAVAAAAPEQESLART